MSFSRTPISAVFTLVHLLVVASIIPSQCLNRFVGHACQLLTDRRLVVVAVILTIDHNLFRPTQSFAQAFINALQVCRFFDTLPTGFSFFAPDNSRQPIPNVTISEFSRPILAGRSPERRQIGRHTPVPSLTLGLVGVPLQFQRNCHLWTGPILLHRQSISRRCH